MISPRADMSDHQLAVTHFLLLFCPILLLSVSLKFIQLYFSALQVAFSPSCIFYQSVESSGARHGTPNPIKTFVEFYAELHCKKRTVISDATKVKLSI